MKPYLMLICTTACLAVGLPPLQGQPALGLPDARNPFQTQIERYPQEKLHVTTDKEDYILGDTIWLRVHSVDAATHQPVGASRYVYVELRTPDGDLCRRIKLLNRDAVYSGYFPTQGLEREGDYTLTAYTMYMRNQGPDYFFKKQIALSAYDEEGKRRRGQSDRRVRDFTVGFYPEGGYLVPGHDCCVGFKAEGDDGGSVTIRGVLKNDRDEILDTLHTLHAGMGVVYFTPRTGESCYAECTMADGKTKRFDLPSVQNDACVLKVLQTDESFTVQVQSARPLPDDLRLLVHCRGNLCYYERWNRSLPSLIFERAQLPGGVLQILLLDKAGNALSERLVFNRGHETAATALELTGSMKQRTKVRLEVTATEPDGTPATGNVSISVTDRTAVPAPRSGSIYSTLLLTSDLRGYIETPDWYFVQGTVMRTTALDALLLTQGWRRYDVPAVMRAEYADPIYPLEVGQELQGRITKAGLWNRKKRLDRYEMRMIAPKWKYSQLAEIDKEGRFTLNGFDFPDSTLYVLRPAAAKGLLPEATVKIARDSFPEVGRLPRYVDTTLREPYIAQARHYIEQRGQTDMRNILIDTVVVVHHKRLESTKPEHRLASHTWTDEDIKESGAGTILDFISRMPGIIMRGTTILYRQRPVKFMLDGYIEEPLSEMLYVRPKTLSPAAKMKFGGDQTMMSQPRVIFYQDDYDELPGFLWYPLNIVKRVDLIEGSNMVLWGDVGDSRGMISITTKTGSELDAVSQTLPARDVGFSSPLGYQTPAEFYAPTYLTEKARRSMVPDYRTTLYWNPAVELDETGHATIEFYTSDAPADYNVIIEGVTYNGKIIRMSRPIGQETTSTPKG